MGSQCSDETHGRTLDGYPLALCRALTGRQFFCDEARALESLIQTLPSSKNSIKAF